MSKRYACVIKREGQRDWRWRWAGISVAPHPEDAMIGLAVSVAGYDEDSMTGGEILNRFYRSGWRAKMYELKTSDEGDELRHNLVDLK